MLGVSNLFRANGILEILHEKNQLFKNGNTELLSTKFAKNCDSVELLAKATILSPNFVTNSLRIVLILCPYTMSNH